jgi:hypothetical protein
MGSRIISDASDIVATETYAVFNVQARSTTVYMSVTEQLW